MKIAETPHNKGAGITGTNFGKGVSLDFGLGSSSINLEFDGFFIKNGKKSGNINDKWKIK
jgi:hypothetical protein